MTEAIVMMGILLSSFYIFKKAIKHTSLIGHITLSVLWCLLLSLVFAVQPEQIQHSLAIRPLMCVSSIIFILILSKLKPDTAISAYLFSLGLSYSFFYTSSAITFLILAPLFGGEPPTDFYIDFDRPFYLIFGILTLILQLLLSYLLFRIRRFKNGFPFLLKGYAVIPALIVAGALLSFVVLIRGTYEPTDVYFFVAGIIIIGIGIYIWIRRNINVFQWRKTTLRNIELLEDTLAAEKEKNERMTVQLQLAQGASHRIIHRLEAMERKVARQTGCEISKELITIEDIQKLQREYQEDIARIKGRKKLPSAKIKELNSIFELFAQKFSSSSIDFNLKVSGSIPYMVAHVIDKGKLETMIGDHLQDALIAVNASDSPNRSVLAVIGLVGEHYEFTVFDSGIPFEVDTLVRLGTEQITTHKATGGSGIGFMTTFKTMREYGASLVIDEKTPSADNYSKSISIKFDGKNQYIIRTHRQDNFPTSNRYLVIGNTESQ